MKYTDPELRDQLAAAYALGTLRGAARRRFERLMAADPALKTLTEDWALRLNALAERAPAVEPPPALWRAIERGLERRPGWLRRRLFGDPSVAVPGLGQVGLWRSVGAWRAAGLIAATAAVLMFVYVAARPPALAPAGPTHVAVLIDQGARPALVASLFLADNRLVVSAVNLPAVEAGKALELWLLPPAGAPPRSLGLLAKDRRQFELAGGNASALATGALAVSLEPAGGSPTGLPTGPVLLHGAVLPAS